MSAPEFLTTQELAEILRVSPRTVEGWRYREMREQRQIGPRWHQFGGAVRYGVPDFEVWRKTRWRGLR